jgi:hypothetical protein
VREFVSAATNESPVAGISTFTPFLGSFEVQQSLDAAAESTLADHL